MASASELLDQYGIPHATLGVARDASGRVVRASLLACNHAFCDQTGVSATSGDDLLRDAFGIGMTEAAARLEEAVDGTSAVFPQFFRSTSRWFSCHSIPKAYETIDLVLVDVTNYRTDSALVQLREQAYRSFIEHLQMIAFLRVVHPDPVTLFAAGSFREITGYGPDQGRSAESWLEIVHPDDRERVEIEAEQLRSNPDYDDELEYRIVRRDGQVRWVHSYDRHFASHDGSMQLIQGLILDVTERKRQEHELQEANERIQEQNQLLARLARTDALTGLLNRRAMQEQLERELRLTSRGRPPFSVLLIDLDDFKGVNDRYGHRAGDRVLVHLAESLGSQLRASDVRSRWGGEEFMVLFSGTHAEAALRVAEKLRAHFAEHPTQVDGDEIYVTFTGGLVEATSDDTVDSLFSRADKALYQGKLAGRNRVVPLPSPPGE
ncbi:MAG: diguanylate cyclase [Spirochaetota bacterium]